MPDLLVLESARGSTLDIIADIMKGRGPDQVSRHVKARLRRIRTAVDGGLPAVRAMLMRGNETPEEFADRLRHGTNIPLTAFGKDVIAYLLSGEPPDWQVFLRDQGRVPGLVAQLANEDGDDLEEVNDLNKAFADIFADNHLDAAELQLTQLRVRDGVAWLKVFVEYEDPRSAQEALGTIRRVGLTPVPVEEFIPLRDPDNPTRILGGFEYRTATQDWILWSDDSFQRVAYESTGALKPIGPVFPHDFGRVPFCYLGDLAAYESESASMLVDAAERQKELINRASIRSTGGRGALFSTLLLEGDLDPKVHPTNRDPKKAHDPGSPPRDVGGTQIDLGLGRLLKLQPGGTGKFIDPNIPLTDLREDYLSILREAIQLDMRLPGDLVASGTGAAEKPMTVMFHWLISKIQYRSMVQEAVRYHDQKFALVARIIDLAPITAQYSAPDVSAEAIDWVVTYPESPAALFASNEREQDRLDLRTETMSKEEYRQKHIAPHEEPEEVRTAIEYISEQGTPRARRPEAGEPPPIEIVRDAVS